MQSIREAEISAGRGLTHGNWPLRSCTVDRPSAELESLVFIMLSETDACLLREANQREAEKACCNDEK